MIFRYANQKDIDYMAEHSINQTVDRKQPDGVDYVYALEHDGVLYGVGGFRIIVPSCAWCWIDLSEDAKKNMVASYRVIREWMYIG